VGFYDPSTYGQGYTAMMEWMGVAYDRLKPEDLKDVGRLRPYQAVFVCYGWGAGEERALPAGVQAALEEYVQGGGRLFCDYGAVPELATAGLRKISSDWLQEFRVVADPHPVTAGLPLDRPLHYGMYSYLAQAGAGQALLRSGDYDLLVVHRRGAGVCVYSGMLLGGLNLNMAAPRPVKQLLANLIGFLAEVPPKRFVTDPEMLAAAVERAAQEARAALPRRERRSPTIGVFIEPGFPASGMPKDVSAEWILQTLRALRCPVRPLAAADLADPAVLTPEAVGTLIMSYGETFPAAALENLTAYLQRGGGFLSPAGVPLSHPCVREGGSPAAGWIDDGPSPAVVEALFQKVLPFRGFYRAHAEPTLAAVVDPQFLPHSPFFWPLKGGTVGFLPDHLTPEGQPYTRRANVPFVVSGSAWGEPVATPVWYCGRQPQVLCLGFTGDSHPWSEAAWRAFDPAGDRIARNILGDCVALIQDRPAVAVEDVRSRRWCYRDGEPVRIEVEVWGAAGGAAYTTIQVEIIGRDTGQVWAESQQKRTVRQGAVETVAFDFAPRPFADWAYDVLVRATAAEGAVTAQDRTLFTVWRPEVLAAGPPVTLIDGDLQVEGRSTWLAGVNLYLPDNRGIGLMFDTFNGNPRKHPLLDVMDDELGVMAALGMNYVRQSYFGARLGPEEPNDPDSLPQRAADAYLLLTAANRFISALELTQGLLNHPAWQKLRTELGGDDPDFYFAPGPFREKVRAYYAAFVRRYAGARNVLWELINEPDGEEGKDEAERRRRQRLARDWVDFMAQGIRAAGDRECILGTQNTAPTAAVEWDPQVVNSPLQFSALHDYVPAHHFQAGRFHTGFALNYGRPALVGEVGTNSPEAQDRLWAYLFAERAWGYSNFYLYPPEGGQWMLGRGDETEGTIPKPVRLWLRVARYRSRADYLDPPAALLVDPAARLREPDIIDQAGAAYVQLLRRGLTARVVTPRDLKSLPERVHTVFYPAAMPLTEPTRKKLAAFAALPGRRVVALGGEEDLVEWVARRRTRCLSGEPEFTYELEKRDGGVTLVVLNSAGESGMEFLVAGRRVRFQVLPGYAALLDFGPNGELLLIKGFGPVSVDGQPLLDAPLEPYFVAARDGRDLFRSREVEVLAFPPNQVRLGNRPTDPLKAWSPRITVAIPREQYRPLAEWLAAQLRTRGIAAEVQWDRFREVRQTQIRLLAASSGRSRRTFRGAVVPVQRGTWRFLAWPGGPRLTSPWAGAVEVSPQKDCLTLRGNTPGAVALAAQALLSVTSLENYLTVPLAPLKGGASS